MKNTQGGFILKLMLAVVGVCIAFIVLSALAKNFAGLQTLSGTPSGAVPSGSGGSGGGNNQLLRFLDGTPLGSSGASYGSYGASDGASDIPASARSPYAGGMASSPGRILRICWRAPGISPSRWAICPCTARRLPTSWRTRP